MELLCRLCNSMNIYFNILAGIFILMGIFIPPEKGGDEDRNPNAKPDITNTTYINCNLEEKLDLKIFKNAMESLNEMEYNNEDIVTIIDFSKPSAEKRLFILDLKNQKLLYLTFVAHGKNTGLNIATKFSNTNRSLQSSLGLYQTGEPYQGKHGYSLRLDGLEKGFNDNARSRAIVIHGAEYVSEDFIESHGRLGRSWGCPALPVEETKEIIDLIKGGTCLYIYADDKNYLENSILSD